MGNRNTICFIGGNKNDDGTLDRQAPIYFTAHWMGDQLAEVCRTGLLRAHRLGRLDDSSMVARYIFEALLALDPKEELTFRMTSDPLWANDLDNDPIVVDMAAGQVLQIFNPVNGDDYFEGVTKWLCTKSRAHFKTRMTLLFSFDAQTGITTTYQPGQAVA